jgi:hypothetical protein
MNTSIVVDKLLLDTSDPDKTVVTLEYSSNEPAHPLWGGGVKRREFAATIQSLDIMREVFGDTGLDYLHWPNASPAVEHWLKQEPGASWSVEWRKFDTAGAEHARTIARARSGQGQLVPPDPARPNELKYEVPPEFDLERDPVTTPWVVQVVTFCRVDVAAPWVATAVEPKEYLVKVDASS